LTYNEQIFLNTLIQKNFLFILNQKLMQSNNDIIDLEKPLSKMTPKEKLDCLWMQMMFEWQKRNRVKVDKTEIVNGEWSKMHGRFIKEKINKSKTINLKTKIKR